MQKAAIGVIGGSGLYEIEGAKTIEEISVSTPWGRPSDSIVIADIEGSRAAFLPRHSRGHVHLPHEVNYRANIAALKMIGVEEVIAFSAVGSLKETIKPLDFILPDQVIDRTSARESTFFGNGVAAHITYGDPFCPRLPKIIKTAADGISLTMHTGETLICMEGPAFSTRAESNLYRSWGAGVINMSTLPEAKLAREAELCYTVICMCTDYDCWHEEEEHVTIDMVIKNLSVNADNAKKLLKLVIERVGKKRDCLCNEASKFAVITAKDKQNKKQIHKLKKILPEYF
jgi:5'-methylthioadenosine phosphorylase